MPTPSVRQRAHRVLDFLLGLRHPEVFAALGPYGFTDAERVEGHALLAALTAVPAFDVPSAPSDALSRLDGWENRWFPVVRATLVHRFPDVHRNVFGRVTQTSGVELVISVDFVVRKLDALRAAKDATSRAAAAKLEERGVTVAVLDEARALLEEAKSMRKRAVDVTVDHADATAREEALWRYYEEWSAIARVAVKDRRQLGWLGLARVGRKPKAQKQDATSGSVTNETRMP